MVSIHTSGFSYNEATKKFDLITTCNPVTAELYLNVRDKIAGWNTSCQEWLKKGVYERSPFKNR